MKKYLVAVTGLALLTGLILLSYPLLGQAQQPEANPPGLNPFQGQPAGHPLLHPAASSTQDFPFTLNTRKQAKLKPPDEGPEPNQDIVVKADVGQWMICVMTYEGEERHQMARQFVAELRGPNYHLPAYVFNHGREERIAEYLRVRKLMDEQKKGLLSLGVTDPDTKVRVRMYPVKETTAVLIGGYKDMETARRVQEDVKRLKCPDPERVKLDKGCIAGMDPKNGKLTGKQEWVPVNPFPRSFVVRNPSLPHQTQQSRDLDVALLRPLNVNESFSLLSCSKKITLAIKEYHVPAIIQSSLNPLNSPSSASVRNAGSKEDYAALNAHNLAAELRKFNFEAYVLHTPLSSIVCIGGFDSVSDPRLQATQQRYAQLQNALAPHLAEMRVGGLFPDAWPMKVPH